MLLDYHEYIRSGTACASKQGRRPFGHEEAIADIAVSAAHTGRRARQSTRAETSANGANAPFVDAAGRTGTERSNAPAENCHA